MNAVFDNEKRHDTHSRSKFSLIGDSNPSRVETQWGKRHGLTPRVNGHGLVVKSKVRCSIPH